MTWREKTDIVNDFFKLSNGSVGLFPSKIQKQEEVSDIKPEIVEYGEPDTAQIASQLFEIKGPMIDENSVFPNRHTKNDPSLLLIKSREEFNKFLASEVLLKNEPKQPIKSVRERNVLLSRFEEENKRDKPTATALTKPLPADNDLFNSKRSKSHAQRKIHEIDFANKVCEKLNHVYNESSYEFRKSSYTPMMEFPNSTNGLVFDSKNFPAL